ncbi:hypothetical protein ACQKMK_02140 [Viridibacillus arvi]|uniref:hypothetical protein n=1 Tax=Viridibacillus arvi TaxID=263475 RepID=UPI003D0958ED
MFNTVKSKVIAGSAAVVLFSGAGVAFGASDAGTKLKTWYDTQFGQTSAKVETDYQGYQTDKFTGFNKEVDNLKADATNKITGVAASKTSDTTKNIDKQKNEHITAINKEKANIQGYIDFQFLALQTKANIKIAAAAKDTEEKAKAELLKHTDAAGLNARDKMRTDLDAATATAVNDLQTAINNAKTDLQSQLDTTSSKTIKELKDLIDKRIRELSTELTKTTNKYLALQYQFIESEARALEDIAKQQLDAVVNGI